MISIIMPAYNAAQTIEESINSVINQSFKEWELLIIDDASSDNTRTIIKEFEKKDNRIRVLTNETNLKVAKTRNVGIKLSKYKFIAFIDSDDIWEKNKLNIQYTFMIEHGANFTSTDYEIINEDSKSKNKYVSSSTKNYKQLLRGNSVGTSTVMINSSKITNLYFKDIGHEDYELWLRILKENNIKVVSINHILTKHRMLSKSLSSNKFKTMNWTWSIFRKQEHKGILMSIYLFVRYAINSITKTKRV